MQGGADMVPRGMVIVRPALIAVAVLGSVTSCVGSIADYDTLEVNARRGNFAAGEDFLSFTLSERDDRCISTPEIEATFDDDVSADSDGGGGNPCEPPADRLTVVLDEGTHTLTIDEGERDMEVRFSMPPRPGYDDGGTIVQGKTVVLPFAVHRAPDALAATLTIGAGDPLELIPVVEGTTVRLPIPDGLITGDPQAAILSVKVTYRDEAIDDIDDVEDADFDIVDDIGVQVSVREKNLLDDLLDIILGT